MALFTFFLVVVGFGQGIFLYRTDQGTHKAADAAKDSADIAKDTLVATNRPWISIQVIGNSGIDWEDRGARISVKFKLTNIGKSPATNVYFQAASVLPKIGEPTIPIKAMADFAADIRRRRGLSEIAGEAYFPDQPYEVGIAMLIDRTEFAGLLKEIGHPDILPRLVACASYSINSNNELRQTCTSYYITKLTPGSTLGEFSGIALDENVPAPIVGIGTAFYSYAD